MRRERRWTDQTGVAEARTGAGHRGSVAPVPRESVIQEHTVQLLTLLGYRVQQTQHQYKLQRCPGCGHAFRPEGGYGTSLGIADCLVSCDRWPDTAPLVLCLEMKGARTALSAAQKELYGLGRIIVARSEREAVEGIQAAERAIFGRVYGRTMDWEHHRIRLMEKGGGDAR